MAKARQAAGLEDAGPPAGVWSKKRILGYAPDEASIPAAQKVLKKGGFGTVEATADGKGWWVVCQGLTDVYQTSVRVEDGEFTNTCTCPSPKNPCKHVLALLLYLLDHPEQRAVPEAPKYAATDFEALVKAAFQNPDDDTPRLVFADFLEENDQPDRAALIRTQCALAREKKTSDRAKQLKREEKPLVARLLEQVGTLPEGVTVEFRRGFLHMVGHMHALREPGALPERFTRLFRDGWVETFHAVGFMYERLEEEHAPLLALVGELDFSGTPMLEDGMVSLVALAGPMRETGRLCRVQVARRDRKAFEELTAAQETGQASGTSRRMEDRRQHHGLTPESLELLIRAGRLRTARQLVLGGRLGDAEAVRLANSDLGGVQTLYLTRWQLGVEGARAFAQSAELRELIAFGIINTTLTPAAVAALVRDHKFANLEALHFDTTQLSDEGLSELAAASPFSKLREVGLDFNGLTANGVAAFLRSPNFPALTSVTLNDNLLRTPEVLPLLLGASRPELSLSYHGGTFRRHPFGDGASVEVDLGMRPGDELFSGITESLVKKVTAFAVTRAELEGKGLRSLARALGPSPLKELEFRDMPLKNAGAVELAAAFTGFTLETLRVASCRLQASGIAALAGSPLLDSVKVLDLTGNAVGKAGARALLNSTHLGSIERLELPEWTIPAEERKQLRAKFGKKMVTK